MEMITLKERLPTSDDLDQYNSVLVKMESGAFYVAEFSELDEEDECHEYFYNQHDYFVSDEVVSWCKLPV